MKSIEYKLSTDHRGTPKGLEIWQGDQHILISLETHNQTQQGKTWGEIKARVDILAEQLREQAQKELTTNSGYPGFK